MEYYRTSTSSQRLSSTFDTLINSSEADITAITVFRPEPFPTGNNRDIQLSVKELVYGGKTAGMGASAKSLDRKNELLSSKIERLKNTSTNLEHSTGHNAALFQEKLEKIDKVRLEFKDDIQSSIKNISPKNELPRQSTPILDRNVLNLNNDLYHTISSNEEVAIFKEDFSIPDEYIGTRSNSLFTKSEKKWYYKMRQDHGKNSWPWWEEKVISKWSNDSWRFRMKNSFEEAIFNIERDGPISWFLKQKDRLSALHPDRSETMAHKRILRKCGGDLENSIRSRCIEPFSKEDYINSMEDITTRTKIGRN
ncbi:hypothetical protein O181_053177 [Austropuccinia psidii MF-1]|uniref:Uncharacterized protein n=1 Tax=Austropuccinia psidii MF-1 TaxID=1389203 RepID=A0A9Q3HR93_9BASI|nr:hypothetical protein [Austropuccinia psidii MF-1]